MINSGWGPNPGRTSESDREAEPILRCRTAEAANAFGLGGYTLAQLLASECVADYVY